MYNNKPLISPEMKTALRIFLQYNSYIKVISKEKCICSISLIQTIGLFSPSLSCLFKQYIFH